MTPIIKFDPQGSPLWVEIQTLGLYGISYDYSLLAASAEPPPKILTTPPVIGDNSDGVGKYFYPVLNQTLAAGQQDPLAKYDGRFVTANFHVVKLANDDGFTLKITLLQGATTAVALPLGGDSNDPNNNTIGAGQSSADILLEFQLQKI